MRMFRMVLAGVAVTTLSCGSPMTGQTVCIGFMTNNSCYGKIVCRNSADCMFTLCAEDTNGLCLSDGSPTGYCYYIGTQEAGGPTPTVAMCIAGVNNSCYGGVVCRTSADCAPNLCANNVQPGGHGLCLRTAGSSSPAGHCYYTGTMEDGQ